MPIKLNDLAKSAAKTAKLYTPKFFATELTGTGKKTGIINENVGPMNVTSNLMGYNIIARPCGKTTRKNGDTSVHMYGMNILPTLLPGTQIRDFDPMNTVTVSSFRSGGGRDMEIRCSVEPTLLILEETDMGKQGTSRKLLVNYVLKTACVDLANPQPLIIGDNVNVYEIYDPGNQSTTGSIFNTTASRANMKYNASCAVDAKAYGDYIANYSLYNQICKLSEIWQTDIDRDIAMIIDSAVRLKSSPTPFASSPDQVLEPLMNVIFPHMEHYEVPLDVYNRIYKHVNASLPKNTVIDMCKTNINLLLSDTLENLSLHKGNIKMFAPQADPAKLSAEFNKLSQEQKAAVSTDEPLTLVQAGAGCGKSHTIMQRIDFMIASGVNQDDIMVLSFTNAAADNIKNRNPGVHSMTIAKMIHTIYEANFPTHELSSIGTLINCIEIAYPALTRPAPVEKFRSRLYDLLRGENNSYTKMNNFVEKNYDTVIKVLDTVRQTTLELEIIICYQKIETLKETAETASKYLILDEVQDNSVFEFIYILKYVDKHNESLFIVGDCSQTLYAFRAANPMAMNILENSGIFKAYPLQINFRSKQEILDFANERLDNIDANRFANIQLQANSLASVDEQSFKNKVHLHYEHLTKIGDWNMMMPVAFKSHVKKYIDSKLSAGEQIAFLSFTRFTTFQIEKILREMYPDKKIVNMIPEKQTSNTLFSMFIKKYWNDIQFAPTANIMNVISTEIGNRLGYLVTNKDKMLVTMQKMVSGWKQQYGGDVTSWYSQYTARIITKQQFLDNVKETMLKYEISTNAIHQALLSAKNAQQKTAENIQDANFILSTIHSAKGLEFENAVVIYRDENGMSEEDKRMYYVALTRAMKSEFILAYGTLKNPQIQADYQSVVNALKAKANPSDTN